MKLSEFKIGEKFYLGGKGFLCTDVGSRVAIGIPLQANVSTTTLEGLRNGTTPTVRQLTVDETLADDWLKGPPYTLSEIVFDENDIDLCTLTAEADAA